VYRLWCLRTGLPGQISPEDEVPPQWKADIDMNADYYKLSHEAFDALADQLRAGASREEALKSITALTGNCVTCHAVYRLDEV